MAMMYHPSMARYGFQSTWPFFGRAQEKAKPTKWSGAPGFAVYGGYVDEAERDVELADHDSRYRTFQSILVNTSIVAASVRYYLNLVGRVAWSYTPSDDDADGMYAERIEEMFTRDLRTPWHLVVRRASMYRFYGHAVQEWLMQRRADGWLAYVRIRSRPQHTIERWDVDIESGDVLGFIQQRSQDSAYLYIPREKVLYLVDDALSDSPTGVGVLRHLVPTVHRLRRYEQLEGFGFERDLRNIPVGRLPFDAQRQAGESGELSEEQAKAINKPILDFLQNHTIGDSPLAVTMDSAPYEGESGSPSSVPQYDVSLLSGSQSGLSDMGRAIERVNVEMARILGTEQLFLGTQSGSYALSRDKTEQFHLMIESALTDLRDAVMVDLIERVFRINGWPMEMMPEPSTESVRPVVVEEIVASLRDIAMAGVPLASDDPVVNQLRDMMGVEHAPEMGELDTLVRRMASDDGDDDEDEMVEDEDEGVEDAGE